MSAGADASRVVLKQTSLVKTREGLQIFVRHQTGKAKGLQLDVDYFVKLLALRAQNLQIDLKSDAFVLDYRTDWESENLSVEEKSNQEDKEESLRKALVSLFRNHSTEKLYTSFPYQKFDLDHHFKLKESRARFLMMNLIEMSEDHELKIRYPKSEAHPELDPKDEEISLFRSKKGRLEGMDLLGFSTSLIEAQVNRKSKSVNWDFAQPSDPNPANIPFGKAFWRQVVTERDLTGAVKDVSLLQHVWGGWHLGRSGFLKLIDEIVEKLKLPPEAKYRLVEKETFHNVKAIDFYKITANLSVREAGLHRLRDLVIQPSAAGLPGEKSRFLSRLFQKLSEKISGVSARQSEKKFLDEIMGILGDGDRSQGAVIYKNECQKVKASQNPNAQSEAVGTWIHGTFFECLTPWAEDLMKLGARFPEGDQPHQKKQQVRWMNEVLYRLEDRIPISQLLKFLGKENVIFFVQVNGFRSGDEDGDLSYISNTWGNPPDDFDEANGVFQFYARKTGVIPTEIDKSQGSFR